MSVELENGTENGRGHAVRHRVLALLVRLVLEQRARAEHASEHRVRMLFEHLRIDNKTSLVNYERDRVVIVVI